MMKQRLSILGSTGSIGVQTLDIVRENPDSEGSYEIIAGERRWRAAKMAGLTEIPAIVFDGDELKAESSDFYIENANSEDIMEDYRMKKAAAGLKKYHQDYTELMMENPEAGRRMLNEKRKFIEGYAVTNRYRGAINKIKKAMKDGRIEADRGMKEIRNLRKEFFKTMDDFELK